MPGAIQPIGIERHQTLSGKADHVAKETRVRALLKQLAQRDLVVGLSVISKVRLRLGTQPYRNHRDNRRPANLRQPLGGLYGWLGGSLRHEAGHDRRMRPTCFRIVGWALRYSRPDSVQMPGITPHNTFLPSAKPRQV